jgi:hypothetical protein
MSPVQSEKAAEKKARRATDLLTGLFFGFCTTRRNPRRSSSPATIKRGYPIMA